VRFTLEEPFPSFLYYTTIGLLPAHLLGDVPAADLPSHDFSTRQPVGTGRFMVDRVSPDRVVLATYPGHWKAQPYLGGLELWFYADEKGLLIDYERGVVHGLHPSNPETLSALGNLPGLNVFSAPIAGYGMVYLNLEGSTLPFFQEKEVRQALLYALDRQALIDLALDGQGLVANSPIPPTLWAHDASVRSYGYDPERAVGLLDASGWLDSDADRVRDKDGVALSFTLSTPEDPAMLSMAEEIARQWSEVGVDARVQPLSAALATYFVRDRVFEATLAEFALAADPDPYPLWHSTQAGDSGQNFAGYANEEADLVMEEIRSTTDPERRLQLYHAFQQIFAEEVPSLLIYQPIYVYGVSDEIRNVQLSPLLYARDRFRNFQDWYLETEEIEVSGDSGLDKTGE
jgi:peptide/nickel transport system substrate-binding protein